MRGEVAQAELEHLGKSPEKESFGQILGRCVYDKGRFGDNPERVPLHERYQIAKTDLGVIAATCDYGGPNSKYDDENQDSFVFGKTDQGNIFAAVIDGAGGSGGGLEASIIANNNVDQSLTRDVVPVEALRAASKTLTDLNKANKSRDNNYRSIYATAVAALVEKSGKVFLAASGDAKVATIRNGVVLREGTTRMQNIATDLVDKRVIPAEGYYTSLFKHQLTGGLGVTHNIPPVDQEFQGQHGDRLVLASDGLWDLVSEYEIAELSKVCTRAEDFQKKVYELAYARNNATEAYSIKHAPDILVPMMVKPTSGDNITVAVIELDLKEKESDSKIKVGESYIVRTPGQNRMLCFSFHIVDITATEIVFIDFTKLGQEQRHSRAWWKTIIDNPKTKIEKLEAHEPKPGDKYRFMGIEKNGTPYDFQLTVQRVEGNTVHCIGNTGNVFERSREFWNALFVSPGARVVKIL